VSYCTGQGIPYCLEQGMPYEQRSSVAGAFTPGLGWLLWQTAARDLLPLVALPAERAGVSLQC